LSPPFREGFKALHRLGHSFDAWLLEPQLPDLIDLARAFPDMTIVLDHVATPLGIGRYKGKREERFAAWSGNVEACVAAFSPARCMFESNFPVDRFGATYTAL
jgi:predicted TIM-barrel fold metal-dependent hydrolase